MMKRWISVLLIFVLLLSLPFGAAADSAFTDINGHWAKSQIEWVTGRGLLSGDGNGHFMPNGMVNRAQMVTALYQMAGKPSAASLPNPFTDVSAGIWYENAVKWGYSTGVPPTTT